MERRFTLVVSSVLYLVGLPVLAMAGADGGSASVIAFLLVGAASIGLLVWIVATGVAMGMREVRDEREPDRHPEGRAGEVL